jgi:hypothetical protein
VPNTGPVKGRQDVDAPTEHEIKAVNVAYDNGHVDGLRAALREARKARTVEEARQRILRLLETPDGA